MYHTQLNNILWVFSSAYTKSLLTGRTVSLTPFYKRGSWGTELWFTEEINCQTPHSSTLATRGLITDTSPLACAVWEPGKGGPQNKPWGPQPQGCVTSLLHSAWEPWPCLKTSIPPEDGLVKDLAICRSWQCIYSTPCRRIETVLNPALAQDGTATRSGAVRSISRSSVSLFVGPAQS